ncbi:MAG: MFS transporter, partial [Chloroflexota bacterium]|nr:MFS transporter [Chloroflexota bacterium]
MLSALRQRDFSLLWLGGLISLTGDWTLMIGLPIALYMMTHSVVVLSVSLLVSLAPTVLFGSVAGVLIDRWDRKRILIVSNTLLAALLTPLLLARSVNAIWLVYLTLFIEACLEQFTRPTESALLPSLVSEDQLVSANGLISIASNIARLGGPALGGVIAAFYGLPGVVLVDAGSFLIAALLFALIRASGRQSSAPVPDPQATPSPVASGYPMWQAIARAASDWRDGLGAIFHQRTLAIIFFVFCVTSIGEGIMGTLFVVFITVNAGGDARSFGGMMSAQAVGGLIGGAFAGLVGKRLLSRWALGISALLFGALDLAIFNAPTYYPALAPVFAPAITALRETISWAPPLSLIGWLLALFVVVGIPGVALASGLQTVIQTHAPERYLGRVFGALMACSAFFLGV